MIDMQTLELIKNNKYLNGVNFPEKVHCLVHSFYKGFDLDRQDEEYRYNYIVHFIQEHEAFIINYQTNIFNANIKNTDNLSSELTFNRFLDTLAAYLTKYYDDKEA